MNKFFDSNILLYLIELDDPKFKIAEELLRVGGTISVQVLNEFATVARRKFKLDLSVIEELLELFKEKCVVISLTLAIHERAIEIARVTNIGIYDCNIIAAAELSGCDTLYTEDLNNGQRIGKLAIVNPFE